MVLYRYSQFGTHKFSKHALFGSEYLNSLAFIYYRYKSIAAKLIMLHCHNSLLCISLNIYCTKVLQLNVLDLNEINIVCYVPIFSMMSHL